MADNEIYKGYEILIHQRQEWWVYDIPDLTGFRHPDTYNSAEEALTEAKKAIDNLPKP